MLLLGWELIVQMSVKLFILMVPEDTETYIQETGRAGRDGRHSLAVIVPTTSANRKTDKSMTAYQSNQVYSCRRDILFSDIDNYSHEDHGKCLCCDICMKCCNCGSVLTNNVC